jgi:energy-coupling factor transporter ATP-binding protein EcfA2
VEKLDKPSRGDKRAKAETRAPADQPVRHETGQPGAENPVSAPESTITLWGGMGSGKSTLLAALSRAVQDPMYGKWSMWPEDHASQKFLSDLAHILYRERTFPNATLTEQRPVRFTLAGDLTGTRFSRGGRRRWRRGGERSETTEFKVTLRDLPGEAFDLRSQTGAALGGKLIKDLGAARAMVYVVDPVREWQVNGDDGPLGDDARQNADFFTDVLGGVATEVNMRGERHGNQLPHSIAVCLAKFDDDRVFRFACEQGNVRLNPRTGQPEVMDAKRLFDGLCQAFPQGSLREIQQQIELFFAPERVGYFVCSAVGFWIDPERGFDFENPSLVNPVEDAVRLVAPPRPVNILEPFLFLRGLGPRQT